MRITIIKIVFMFLFSLIVVRLFYWQVVKADELTAMAEKQHLQNIKIQANRGSIYFSDGSLLTTDKPNFTLFVQPKILSQDDKKKITNLISPILKSEEVELYDFKKEINLKLNQDLFWFALNKNVDLKQKKQIDDLNLKGLGFDQGSARFYPEGSSSAHILGFVGLDSKGRNKGYFGVEGYYDGELQGVSGSLRHEKDATGLPILIGRFLTSEPKNGKDLTLNIDRFVQYTVENSLKKGIEKYGAKTASAVVMDPHSGAVIALASYPNYDPAKYFGFPKEFFKNPIVADQYEPGSTFKVLVMAAALNEEAVKPDTKCDICGGSLQLSGYSIRTWDNKYRPNLIMTDVIVYSDNTGMIFVSRKLGLEKFYQYLHDFGFSEPTNIDLQDETSPGIRDKNKWKEIDLATASFGQGIAVTPIQMVTAVSAIANGGSLMEPQMVKIIQDENGQVEIKPKVVRNVITKETAQKIKKMMVKAVDEGEAKVYKPKGFKIAGKTGTAQIPVAGYYDEEKTIASFVGFAPADDPKFVMLVRFDQPSASIFGSETAAPTFFEIAKDLFVYYNLPPTE